MQGCDSIGLICSSDGFYTGNPSGEQIGEQINPIESHPRSREVDLLLMLEEKSSLSGESPDIANLRHFVDLHDVKMFCIRSIQNAEKTLARSNSEMKRNK